MSDYFTTETSLSSLDEYSESVGHSEEFTKLSNDEQNTNSMYEEAEDEIT